MCGERLPQCLIWSNWCKCEIILEWCSSCVSRDEVLKFNNSKRQVGVGAAQKVLGDNHWVRSMLTFGPSADYGDITSILLLP